MQYITYVNPEKTLSAEVYSLKFKDLPYSCPIITNKQFSGGLVLFMRQGYRAQGAESKAQFLYIRIFW